MSNSMQAQLRVEPPNWWAGMRNTRLQLMLHGEGLAHYTPGLNYEGVSIVAWHPGASDNYLFIDLEIGPTASAGTFEIQLRRPEKSPISISYRLKNREKPAESFKGFDASDAIYLITPDRFANGNPGNDIVKGMREEKLDRKDDYGRHGGDIEGIRQHLDYIEEMGFTAIWPSPLLTNDMPRASYHGYAITDFYEVDPRFGNLETYQKLAQEAAGKGIKLIMDQVVNHCGLYHWWMEDLPFPDWIHYQENFLNDAPFTVTNHRRTVNQDPYASHADKQRMNQGWFVPSMPDLNQSNPFLATYLIQNSIWWIETLQLGGIRQDTYPYPNKHFMADWARSIMEEYPNFNIVGEEWSYNPLLVGYWQHGSRTTDGYASHLRTTMDFPLQRTLVEALNSEEEWDSGLNLLYEALANDFYYPRPIDIMLFGDNHDMDRLFTQLGESPLKMEMALAFIALAPRIPQFYYGTEILMENSAKPGDHGLIRTDFPGGWKGDNKNAFTGKGLSGQELKMQQYLRRILQFRKTSKAITRGSTLHFAPENGLYLLLRRYDDETVLLLLNKNKGSVKMETSRFSELELAGKDLENLITGEVISWDAEIVLQKPGAYIWMVK
ncbi:glycoside hydrolase family 13 protein [Robiginitalea sp. IMCC43444]|uniref:glycoside hydrolase family 13 protein n=1 Tax=Robiginitalea sp. IMCC43444 TaxID=3459121 RepID=UPI004042EC0D